MNNLFLGKDRQLSIALYQLISCALFQCFTFGENIAANNAETVKRFDLVLQQEA